MEVIPKLRPFRCFERMLFENDAFVVASDLIFWCVFLGMHRAPCQASQTQQEIKSQRKVQNFSRNAGPIEANRG